MHCLRPINTNELAEIFVRQVLGERNVDRVDRAVKEIVSAEIQVETVSAKPTLTYRDYRSTKYKTDESRLELREKILDELFTLDRLDDDDDITLGKGGAKPSNGVSYAKQAFLVTGLPASGKSMISTPIADYNHAYILDSDYAKRKLPEYDTDFGATITHEESSLIVNGADNRLPQFDEEESLLSRCIENGCNIVLPRIGHNKKTIQGLAQQLYECKYSVHLILVRLSREKATQRAFKRYRSSHRYVPLPLIFDGYANDPTIVYYDLKRENYNKHIFSSFSMVSTDVPESEHPRLLDAAGTIPLSDKFVDFSDYMSYNNKALFDGRL